MCSKLPIPQNSKSMFMMIKKNIFTENLPFDNVFQRVTKVSILTYILN